jgi:hypothetical protein
MGESGGIKGWIPMIDLGFDFVVLAERVDYWLKGTSGRMLCVFNRA